MATTTEERINQMYDSQLASTKEQLTNDYNTANSELDVQKQKNQKAADTNLNRTAVESQKATVNDAEYYAAAGLTSGARAQARIARENQLQSDLTAIRTAQQEADAETERQRGLLSQEYAAAIRKAQADNDFQRAQALYTAAEKEDERLLQQKIAAADILGAAGDFSLHGAAYGMTPEQIAALQTAFDRQANETTTAAEKADLEATKLMAQSGDFSRLGALYGLTAEEIALLNSVYASETNGSTETGSNTSTGDDTGTDGGSVEEPVAPTEPEEPTEPETPAGTLFPNSTDFDNGTLDKSKIEEMQRYFGVENVDGMWGNQSAAAAGNRTAKDAWDYYQQQLQLRKGEIQDWLIDYVTGTKKIPAGYDLDRFIEVTGFLTSREEKEYAREVLAYLMTQPDANADQNTKPGGRPTSWIVK